MSEEQTTDQETDVENPLGLSDEAMMEMPEPSMAQADTAPEEDSTDSESDDQEEEIIDDEENEGSSEEGNQEEVQEEEVTDETKEKADAFSDTETDTKQEAKTEDTETQDTDTSDIDFKAEYQKLMAPFRANGKDMQIASVDDALTLMKMGANYNKKMAGLKPNLKLLKMLENNDLLDEAKISYLIDLDKKDPGAVAKVLKDSGVDPLDIDTDKEVEYKPNTYTVDDKEVELDGVLDEIRETKSFQDTIDIIGNKWDDSSKQVLLDNPTIIKTINDHVSSGIYQQIHTIIESERILGRLTGLSDIEAYKQVGDAIQANGGFDNKPADTANESTTTTTPRTKESPELKNRKKAASSTKSTVRKKKSNDYNPLAMSDEEFDKISNSQYM